MSVATINTVVVMQLISHVYIKHITFLAFCCMYVQVGSETVTSGVYSRTSTMDEKSMSHLFTDIDICEYCLK